MPPPASVPPPPGVVSSADTPLKKTGPSPDKMTFSAKKRFFEKEIKESTLPAAKPGNVSLALPNLISRGEVST